MGEDRTTGAAWFGVLRMSELLDRVRGTRGAVTAAPPAFWTGPQLVAAFPSVPPPKYLPRDREGIYGAKFTRRVAGLGIAEKTNRTALTRAECP